MPSGNCQRCGSYNYAQNGQHTWTFCQNCGTVNADAMPEPSPVSIVAAAPERSPVVVRDRHAPGTGVFAEPLLHLAHMYEGTLLAILPPTSAGCNWTILTRRPVESELSRVRAALAEASVKIGQLQVEETKARAAREAQDKAAAAEVAKLKSELEYVTNLKSSANAQLEVLREKTQMLEADIGKIRAAIGSKQMAEILAAGES